MSSKLLGSEKEISWFFFVQLNIHKSPLLAYVDISERQGERVYNFKGCAGKDVCMCLVKSN